MKRGLLLLLCVMQSFIFVLHAQNTQREKLAQRQFFFWYKPEERRNIINELRRIGRQDLIDKLYGMR